MITRIVRDQEKVLDLLIDEEQIVAIFQGKGEWGPRALGNRSILFDPRHKEAKQIVKLAKYRPIGERGIAFNVAHDHYSPDDPEKKIREANSTNIIIAMIESEEGVKNCEEILSVEGIDIGWLGHFDLTDSLRVLGDFKHELFAESIEKVSKAGKITNKPLGFLDINQSMLVQFRELGFSVLGYGHEVLVFQKAFKDGIEMIKHLKPGGNM